MTAGERAGAIAAGASAGFFGGLFGVGGGAILVPLLTYRFALTQHQAHGTSLAVIGATAVLSMLVYAAHGNVAWRPAIVVGLASAVSARWGARLTGRVSSSALARAFAVFLVVVAARQFMAPAPMPLVLGPVAALALDIGLGIAIGLLAGFMGVGGGILAVPAFTLLLGMDQALAQGTSLAVILAAAPAGAWEHARRGNVVGRLVPWLSVGAVVAGPFAAWGVQRLPHVLLARAFAVFLLANAIYGWIREGRRAAAAPAPAPSTTVPPAG